MQRVDAVDALLFRRRFRADFKFDNIDTIALYTDSSPVSSSELQGMVCDIKRKDGDHERVVLPGSTLCYGMTDSVSKTIALLWSIYILVGPWEENMKYFFSKVISATTDSGVEGLTIFMPDITHAFIRWVGGDSLADCSRHINPDERLLPFAVRVQGWGHSMGNVVKKVTNLWLDWPMVLDRMRACCKFYKNNTWRQHVVKGVLRSHPDYDVRVLKSFSADFAKWRYETVYTVTHALSPLKQVSTEFVCREWFANPQDRAVIDEFFKACEHKEFWEYVEHSHREIFEKIEVDRRWGLICECPEHLQQRRDGVKHISCVYNSCRLRNAWTHLSDSAASMLDRANTLRADEVGGCVNTADIIKTQLRQVAGQYLHRNKYLSSVPWSLSRADSEVGAQAFIDQVTSKELHEHDAFTQWLWSQLSEHLQVRAAGGPLHAALADAVRRINLVPLDEGAGEWYHSAISYEKSRAAASTTTHLKQSTRQKAALKRIRKFGEKYGQRGRDIIAYEWRNYKRLLQTRPSRRWFNKKMGRKAFFLRLYREDELAETNWSLIASKQGVANPVVPDGLNNTSQLRNEYVRSSVEPGTHYSMEVPADQGASEAADVTTAIVPHEGSSHFIPRHFHILQVAHSHSRAHVVHTCECAEDIALKAPLAFQIVREVPRQGTGDASLHGRPVNVFADSAPEWVQPHQLGPWESWSKKLYKWRVSGGTPASGCLMLCDKERAKCMLPVLHPQCPTLQIIQYLESKGWKPFDGRVVHTSKEPGFYDGKEAMAMKRYLQVVARLDRPLALCPEIPSRQPIHFYKLLLDGVQTQPGMSSKAYMALVKKHGKPTDEEELPIEDAQEVFDPDDDPIVGAPIAPAPGPTPERPAGVRLTPAIAWGFAARRKPKPPIGTDVHATGHAASSSSGHPVPGRASGDPDIVCGPVGGVEGGEDEISGALEAQDGGDQVPRAPPSKRGRTKNAWKDGLDGAKLTYKPYEKVEGGMYRNFKIKCTNPAHKTTCMKTKGRHPTPTEEEDIKVLAFLHAWLLLPDDPGGLSHGRNEPDDAAVAAYLQARGAELAFVAREVVADADAQEA